VSAKQSVKSRGYFDREEVFRLVPIGGYSFAL